MWEMSRDFRGVRRVGGGLFLQCEPGKLEDVDQRGIYDIPPLSTCWASFWVIKIPPLLSNALVSSPSNMLAHVHLPCVYLHSPCLLSLCCRACCCLYYFLYNFTWISFRLPRFCQSLFFFHLKFSAFRSNIAFHPWQHTSSHGLFLPF